jgi:hypothetical protein
MHSGKKLRQQEMSNDSNSHDFNGFELSSPGINSNTFDNSKLGSATKYGQLDSHNISGDPDKNFSAHVQSLYATTNTQSESGFVKT